MTQHYCAPRIHFKVTVNIKPPPRTLYFSINNNTITNGHATLASLNFMHKEHRILITLLAIIASIPAIVWLLSEFVVYYEMVSTGANTRAELGDDLGLGILFFMVVPLGTLIGAFLVGLKVWFHTGKYRQ